ncbi:MAG TPA: cardiolipin synthase [Prolixibacteraceae bacterium]|nr:cardiolipin synthase [Prolixibacteraceae bacterium]
MIQISSWHEFFSSISLLLNGFYVAVVAVIVLLIILENRSPIRSVSWILVVTLVPLLGIVLYFFFGQQYRKQILVSIRALRFRKRVKLLAEEQLKQLSRIRLTDVDPRLAEKKDIMALLLRNDRAFLSRNKEVCLLNNGSETFPELIRSLKTARHHIHMEFYIFNFDVIGREIFSILKEKARQGVEVRIIFDSVGSARVPLKIKREAREAGIRLRSFQKVIFPLLSSHVNYRNHRKIIVIDGSIGFTGGLNIADRYAEEGKNFWRDTFVKIVGRSAAALQAIFINDWFYVSKENIYHDRYFTEEEEGTQNLTQILSSGPDSDWQAISQFYFSAITTARNRVYIVTPYFIPNEELSFALKAAALRGIDVRILIPSISDTIVSHWSSLSYVNEMIRAGVKMYRYNKGFCHSKLLIADEVLSSVGSANFDYRSLETNFEVCAVFYDPKITAELTRHFFIDLSTSTQITSQEWKKRGWANKLATSLARLFAPLM